MVGHQHIGVHGAVMLQRGFAQFLSVVQVVGVIGEAGLAVIAALDDMLRDAGKVDAGYPSNVPIWR